MNRLHLTAFSLAVFALILAMLSPGAQGAVLTDAEYSYEDNGATLVVTVGKSDEAPLDGTKITSAITKIVKRGEGVLMAETSTETALSAFTGDFIVEKGVYWYKHAYGFGAHGAATIDILDGAMIRCSGTTTGAFDNKTINFYGAPPKGQSINGTWYSMRGKTHLDGIKTSVGLNVRLVVHDADTTFFFQGNGSNNLYGTFDLAGKTLEFESTGNGSILYLAGTVVNGGTLAVDCAQIVNGATNSTNLTFEAASAATGKVRLINNGVLNFKNADSLSNGWTLEVVGGNARGNTTRFPTATWPRWNGPVVLGEGATVASYSGYSQWASNTLFNIQGPVSGTGAVSVGPGWLNLFSSDASSNTFSGTVTVTGQSEDQTQTYKTAPGGGGIGVWNGALCFPNAESVTFTDSARFEFMDATPTTVPTLTFAGGAGDVQTIKGGSGTNRSTMSGIVKTGAGTLVVTTPAHVTGPVVVSNGVLRIPGTGGLREWMLTSADDYDLLKSHEPWNLPSKITVTDLGVNKDGPYRLLSQNNWPPKGTDRPLKPYGYVYHGYVWNDSDSPVTMKVLHCLLPYTRIWFGSDHSTVMEFTDANPDPKEVELQPGATEVFMYGYTYGNNVQWWGKVGSPYALLYATNTTWTVAEFSTAFATYKADSTAANKKVVTDMISEMTRFTDGGQGILLTADISGLDASPLPVIDDLVFANGAVLDLLHNSDYSVKNLTGSPTVVNAGIFGITNNWTILAANFPAADATVRHPMTVDGALAFSDGATFSIDNEAAISRDASGLVVATATDGITGTPVFAGGNRKWRLVGDGNSLRLFLNNTTILFLR